MNVSSKNGILLLAVAAPFLSVSSASINTVGQGADPEPPATVPAGDSRWSLEGSPSGTPPKPITGGSPEWAKVKKALAKLSSEEKEEFEDLVTGEDPENGLLDTSESSSSDRGNTDADTIAVNTSDSTEQLAATLSHELLHAKHRGNPNGDPCEEAAAYTRSLCVLVRCYCAPVFTPFGFLQPFVTDNSCKAMCDELEAVMTFKDGGTLPNGMMTPGCTSWLSMAGMMPPGTFPSGPPFNGGPIDVDDFEPGELKEPCCSCP